MHLIRKQKKRVYVLLCLWRHFHSHHLLQIDPPPQSLSAIGAHTCTSFIKQCTTLQSLKALHASIFISNLHCNLYFITNLISQYASLGSIHNAFSIFRHSVSTSFSDVFLWNEMIRCFVDNAHYNQSLLLYSHMRQVSIIIQPDNFTFPALLKACGYLRDARFGVQIHKDVVLFGYDSNVVVANSLISMYAKCQNVENARKVFDEMLHRSPVSWSSIIGLYSQNGQFEEGMSFFQKMLDEGITPNRASILSMMGCVRRQEDADDACRVFMDNGFGNDQSVQIAAVSMYARCGNIGMSRCYFDRILNKDLISWTTMMESYTQSDYPLEALILFKQMILQAVIPDSIALLTLVGACSVLASFRQARVVHGIITRYLFNNQLELDTAVVDMYVKCGSLSYAREVFDKMPERNVISWSTMISGYGMHGRGREALSVFNEMKKSIKPDEITFVSVLSACSHAGLVEEGWDCFNSMDMNFGVKPGPEHHACMVDLLGRAGKLNEALEFIEKMRMRPHAPVWGALLGACRIHHNVELAEFAAKSLLDMDAENSGRYVLLYNIYVAAGKTEEADKIRDLMKRRNVKKVVGQTTIEIRNKVYTFVAGDRSHKQTDLIYTELEVLMERIKGEGYVPDLNFVLHDVEEEIKEKMVYAHSEKLAIVFGLLNSGSNSVIRIRKNLRVCGDCHTAFNFISKVTGKEIVMRDTRRFHHFKDGSCSCGDYW